MTARETTLDGQSILSLPSATPTGLSVELRAGRRGQVQASLCNHHQVCAYISGVHRSQVMVGRITDELSCLFIGPAAIDITASAANAINDWLARTVLKDVSA